MTPIAIWPSELQVDGRPERQGRPPSTLVAEQFAHLDALGLVGPDAARDAWHRYIELSAAAADLKRPDGDGRPADESELAHQLASGDLVPGAVTGALAGSADVVKRARAVLTHATEIAMRNAGRALRAAPEDEWLEALRPIIDGCLDKPRANGAEELFDRVHQLASFVLTPAPGARRLTDPASEHRSRRPDMVWWWRLEHARDSHVRHRRVRGDDEFVEYALVKGPKVTLPVLAEHREEWGVGLYAASEVVENVRAIPDHGRRPEATLKLPDPEHERTSRRHRHE